MSGKNLYENRWGSAPEPQWLWSSLTSTFSLGVWSKYVLQLDKISLWFGCRTTTIPLLVITPTPHQRRFHYANFPTHDDSITPTPPPTPIPLRHQHPHPRRFDYANFQFVILLRWIFNFQFVISLEMDLFVAISKSGGSWFHLKLWWPWTGHYYLLVLQLPKQGLVWKLPRRMMTQIQRRMSRKKIPPLPHVCSS